MKIRKKKLNILIKIFLNAENRRGWARKMAGKKGNQVSLIPYSV